MAAKAKLKASIPNLPRPLDDLALLTHRDHFPEFYDQIVKRRSENGKGEKKAKRGDITTYETQPSKRDILDHRQYLSREMKLVD